MSSAWRAQTTAILAYAATALVFAWPLPLQLTSVLPGPPDGDAGAYVWNQWVFHHEAVQRQSNPYSTDTILVPTGPAILSLHNYTELPDVMALMLRGLFGIVTSFNLVYLLLGLMSAHAMFLLIRSLAPESTAEAWLGGLLFAWSPTLVARGGTHLSLVAAVPLPLFVLALLRLERHGRARDGILLGLVGALAAFCDAYYVIYCGLFVLVYLAVKSVVVSRRPMAPHRWGVRILDGLLALALVLVATTVATGGMAFTVFG